MPMEIYDDRRPGGQKASRGSYSYSREGKMGRGGGAQRWLAPGAAEQGTHALHAEAGQPAVVSASMGRASYM
jgi:hypothetical protein